MMEQFARTSLMFGQDAIECLHTKKIAIFGIGGVGGHCVEALARTGVGALDLYDNDCICLTNLNRQIVATRKVIGMYKVDAMRERILDINPSANVGAYKIFYLPETAESINLEAYDYVIDAVDTITAKLELAVRAAACNVPIISSMGAANKLDPTAFEVADIYETSICPVARVMRRELRKKGIERLKVVYSREQPISPLTEVSQETLENSPRLKQIPASNAFVPPVAGLIMAGEVIKDILFQSGYKKPGSN